jgi:nucleotide-binding universal stress UspA family protein
MEAVRQAARLAAAVGAELTIVHVIDTGRTVDVGGDVEREAEATLEAASAIARGLDVVPDARVVSGDPSVALIEFSEANGVDLVCVGPDAGVLGGAIRIGRVAIHVLRESRCSIVVARHAGPDFPSRIGCAVDGSEASVETALAAAALAAATGAELRLEHVVPVFRGHNAEWTLGPDEASPPELEPSVTAAMSLGVTPIREMAMGRPERALVAAAEREEIDLMVVGHRGIRGVRRVLGSVSEHVAHHAPCSVMVVRDADVAG